MTADDIGKIEFKMMRFTLKLDLPSFVDRIRENQLHFFGHFGHLESRELEY